MSKQESNEYFTDPVDLYLYKIAGISALIAAIVFRRFLNAEIHLIHKLGFISGVIPEYDSSMTEWFAFIQSDRLIGLITLNFFDIFNYILVGFLLLGLFISLGKNHYKISLIALVIGIIGISVYLSSNQALAILSLSDQYQGATNEQKQIILFAGQSLLAINNFFPGGSGVITGFYFVNLSSFIMAVLMLKDDQFSKTDAYIGIISNGSNVISFIFLIIYPELMVIFIPIGSTFLFIWYVKLGIHFIKKT